MKEVSKQVQHDYALRSLRNNLANFAVSNFKEGDNSLPKNEKH
jgi:hypothetical protein